MHKQLQASTYNANMEIKPSRTYMYRCTGRERRRANLYSMYILSLQSVRVAFFNFRPRKTMVRLGHSLFLNGKVVSIYIHVTCIVFSIVT